VERSPRTENIVVAFGVLKGKFKDCLENIGDDMKGGDDVCEFGAL
jgi:hypothetical protein